MAITVSSGREGLIVAEALAFAIEGMSRLPENIRPESNIAELKHLVKDLAGREMVLHHETARRRLDILQGKVPSVPINDAG